MKYVDCNEQYLKQWFEFQFNSKMNWNNYSTYWQIDHVIPCSSFDLSDFSKQKDCFSWKNIRPLNKDKNKRKHAKINQKEIVIQEMKVKHFENNMQHTSKRGVPKVSTTTLLEKSE